MPDATHGTPILPRGDARRLIIIDTTICDPQSPLRILIQPVNRPLTCAMSNPFRSSFTSLLSPTKARRDAAQAKDWACVFSWLTDKYSPHPVPRFEQNDETLHPLLELLAINEAADQEVDLIRRAEEEESRSHELAYQGGRGPYRDMLEALEDALTEGGKTALNDLAEANLLLGTLSADPMEMGERVVELSNSKFEMDEQLRRVSHLHSQLDREMEMMRAEIEKVRRLVDEAEQEDMQQRTAQLNRESKQFTTKTKQYIEQVAALEMFAITSPSILEVRKQEEGVKMSQTKVKALERRVVELHNLPPDLEAARGEYQRAQSELRGLRRRRDELFERMVT